MSKKRRFINQAIKEVDSLCYSSKVHELCKFNFNYLQVSDDKCLPLVESSWKVIADLISKIKNFSANDINYWVQDGNYKSYGVFPEVSILTKPKGIPDDVLWGRFRLNGRTRLAGFRVPGNIHNKEVGKSEYFFDKNTFYVVFIDHDHLFYPSTKK